MTLVYLKGSYDLIHARLAARHEHFMPVALLDSQFAILEEPAPDEHPIVVDVNGTPPAIAAEIVKRLGLTQPLPFAAKLPLRELRKRGLSGARRRISGLRYRTRPTAQAAFLYASVYGGI